MSFDMSVNEKAAEILEQGAEAWESGELGWAQFRFGDAETGVCAMGMCRYQLIGSTDFSRYTFPDSSPYWVALDVLMKVMDSPIDTWNDAPDRTKQEIIDAFKEAAKDLRNQT